MTGWTYTLPASRLPHRLLVYIDGAVSANGRCSALAVVVRGEDRKTYQVWSQRMAACTMLEAEYLAAILALQKLSPFSPRQLTLFSDCHALVAQMTGKSPVRRAGLQVLNLRLRIHMQAFESVVIQHIPTEWNQQACSVSWQVIENDLVI